MRNTMASVAMAMCMMMVQADVRPQGDFNAQRFAGKWYRLGLAYDSPSFVPYRDRLKASMGTVTVLPNGNVNLTMWDATPTGCRSKLYQYERTNVPGQFTYFSTRHNMVKDITVVETNYSEYALVLKHRVFHREYTQVALYGRSPTLRQAIINKFKAFSSSRGFPKESILTPPLAALHTAQIIPQENFDLSKFMGVWYEAAVASTCPLYMQRRRGSPGGAALEMKPSESAAHITVTASTFSINDDTAVSAGLSADVELNVVQTNYDEFAMMVLLSTERPTGTKTTILKLYGCKVSSLNGAP
ncbi:neutrophil gelatinase-associated lipocalin [Neosynchiropus ocellatus]